MSAVGTIIAWAGSATNKPPGMEVCDGRLASVASFPALFASIGHAFGATGDDSKFYFPDLRGRFIRGADLGSGHDPDAAKRTDAQNKDTVVGDKVGSLQADALQDHNHAYTVFPHNDGDIASGEYWAQGPATTGGAQNARVTSETRPTNVALLYLIQAVA